MIEKMPVFGTASPENKAEVSALQEGGPITDEEVDSLFADVASEAGEFNAAELLDEETKDALGKLVENMVASEYKGEILVGPSDIESLPDVVSQIESILGRNSLGYFKVVLSLWKSEGIYRASSDKPWMVRLPQNNGSRDLPLFGVLSNLRVQVIEPEIIRKRRMQAGQQ